MVLHGAHGALFFMNDMEQAIAAFDRYLAGERNLSPHTRSAYLSDLRQFHDFLQKGERDAFPPVGQKEEEMVLAIRAFLADLHKQKLRRTSIYRKMDTLRAIFRFLRRQGQYPSNPALGFPCEKTRSAFRGVVRGRDVPDPGTSMPCRTGPIAGTAGYSGLCIPRDSGSAELTGLDRGDVDLAEGGRACAGKGGKERVVPVGAPAVWALREHLSERRRAGPAPFFFAAVSTARGERASIGDPWPASYLGGRSGGGLPST